MTTCTDERVNTVAEETEPKKYLEMVERDGFVTIPGFFAQDQTMKARGEIEELLAKDAAIRAERGVTAAVYSEGITSQSTVVPEMHTVLFPVQYCPTLALMIDEVLTRPLTREFLRKAVGEHFRLRVDLCRRASGIHDTGPEGDIPHTWHRDRPGEFTFGIFFDDLPDNESSATCGVPGTHMLPFNPIWDFIMRRPVFRSRETYDSAYRYVLEFFAKHNHFGRRVRQYIDRHGRGMLGKRGDFYFFFNDVWHGRNPNLHGRPSIMVRVGGFASEYECPQDLNTPIYGEDVPASIRAAYRADQPVNTDTDTILAKMKRSQASMQFNLFGMARAEKRMAAGISGFLQERLHLFRNNKYHAVPR